MTVEQIQTRQQQQAGRFETAAQIRKLLDAARLNIRDDEDADDVEAEILALVTEEDE